MYELLLDGCELIDDLAIMWLADKFHTGEPLNPALRESLEYLNPVTDQSILTGGARGLEILSLVECRKITDQGIAQLKKLKRLKDLNLLGCYGITDTGIEIIAAKCLFLTQINLSGTFVTRSSLAALKR